MNVEYPKYDSHSRFKGILERPSQLFTGSKKLHSLSLLDMTRRGISRGLDISHEIRNGHGHGFELEGFLCNVVVVNRESLML